MKNLILTVGTVLLLTTAVSAKPHKINQGQGLNPQTHQPLLLTFIEGSLERSSSVDVSEKDMRNRGSYSRIWKFGAGFDTHSFDLGFDGGFSYDEPRVEEK